MFPSDIVQPGKRFPDGVGIWDASSNGGADPQMQEATNLDDLCPGVQPFGKGGWLGLTGRELRILVRKKAAMPVTPGEMSDRLPSQADELTRRLLRLTARR